MLDMSNRIKSGKGDYGSLGPTPDGHSRLNHNAVALQSETVIRIAKI